jgi:hypothetical protein
MAYNSGLPVNYPQYYPQYFQQTQQPQQQIQQQPQIQDGGFLVVPSEDIARTYPVAPGKCLTFKIEGKPIVIEKSMGFSQLEAPKIDRYRLTKEEAPKETPKECQCSNEVEGLKGEINKLWKEIRRLEHEHQSINNVSADETEPDADIESEV